MQNPPKKECKYVKPIDEVEDTTQYGEFISSFDEWVSPDYQKKRAEHLENTDYSQWNFADEE